MHVCLYVCTSISTLISAQKHFVANAFRNARHYFKCLEAFQAKMVNRKVMIERNGVALAPPSVCDRVCACTCPLVQASKQMITMPGACPNFPIRWNDDKSPLYIIYTYVRMYVLYVYNTIYRRHYIWIHHSAFVFITMACIDGRPLIVIRLIVIGLTVPRSFVTVIACRSTAQERWWDSGERNGNVQFSKGSRVFTFCSVFFFHSKTLNILTNKNCASCSDWIVNAHSGVDFRTMTVVRAKPLCLPREKKNFQSCCIFRLESWTSGNIVRNVTSKWVK